MNANRNNVLALTSISRRAISRAARTALMEGLEQRQLLSVAFDSATGAMTVTGTDRADTIEVTRSYRTFIRTDGVSIRARCINILESSVQTYWRQESQVLSLTINAGGGSDTVDVAWDLPLGVCINGQSGNDTLRGGYGNDTIRGGTGSDEINGRAGNDSLYAGEDGVDETVRIVGTTDVLRGGTGNDKLWACATLASDLYGETGNDSLYGGAGSDNLDGGGGNDRVEGAGGADVITGSAGNDSLYGGDGDDDISGGWGNDYCFGEAGNDNIRGDFGNDSLWGGAGDDTLDGGAGADTVGGGVRFGRFASTEDGADDVSGGSGNDILYASYLRGSTLRGGDGNDSLFGGEGDDHLYGEWADDSLSGAGGNDSLYGGFGDDTLNGGAGDDALLPGGGTNDLTGGAGHDRFLGKTSMDDGDRRWRDTYRDLTDSDARIGFQDGGQITTSFAGQTGSYTYAAATWTDADIELLDEGFRQLYEATGNQVLLKNEDGDDTILVRQGQMTASTGSFTASAWNHDGALHMSDYAFDSNVEAWTTVLHEFGHNWDEEYDASGWEDVSRWEHHPLWTSAHDGFTQGTDASGHWYYRNWADFVSGYAHTNPNEDFADSFAAFFADRAGWAAGFTAVTAKFDFIQTMINSMR